MSREREDPRSAGPAIRSSRRPRGYPGLSTSSLPAIDETPSTQLVRLLEGNVANLLWSARMAAMIAIALLIVAGVIITW